MKSENSNLKAIKSGTGYTLSNILISATSLITAPIFTRLLSTSDYGIASNFTAWLTIGLVIVGLGLPYTIGNAKIDFPNNLNKYIASIQTLGSLFALLLLIFSYQYTDYFSKLMELDKALVLVMFLYLVFYPSVIFIQEKYKYLLQYKQNILISLINTFGSIIICLLLIIYVFNGDNKYYGRIIGLILPLFLMGIYFYYKIIKDGWDTDIVKYWKYALKISLPMVPHALAMVVITQMDRIMIIKYCNTSDAGLYSFGVSYAILLLLVSNAILQAYQPWLYINYKNNSTRIIKQSNNFIAASMCILTIVIISIAPEAIQILGAEEFWSSKYVVMPIALGVLFQYIYNTYAGIELYHKKTLVIAIGTVLAAVVNFVLNLTFIPKFGYTAAAYTTFASYFILALFHLIAHRKIARKKVFDDKFIWIISLLTSLICFTISFVYDYVMIRYIILIAILISIAFMNIENIKKAIRTVNSFRNN